MGHTPTTHQERRNRESLVGCFCDGSSDVCWTLPMVCRIQSLIRHDRRAFQTTDRVVVAPCGFYRVLRFRHIGHDFQLAQSGKDIPTSQRYSSFLHGGCETGYSSRWTAGAIWSRTQNKNHCKWAAGHSVLHSMEAIFEDLGRQNWISWYAHEKKASGRLSLSLDMHTVEAWMSFCRTKIH